MEPSKLGKGKTPLSSMGLLLNPKPMPKHAAKMHARRKKRMERTSVIGLQVEPDPEEAAIKQMIAEFGSGVLERLAPLFGITREKENKEKDVVEMGEHAQEGFGKLRETLGATPDYLPDEAEEAIERAGTSAVQMGQNFQSGAARLRRGLRKRGRK